MRTTWIFIIIFFVIISCKGNNKDVDALQVVAPSKGLVAYFPFKSNVNDASGNSHNGTAGGTSYTTDINGGNTAYSLSGITDKIVIPHSTALNLTTFTFCVWINLKQYSVDWNFGSVILAKYDRFNVDGPALTITQTGKIHLRLHMHGNTNLSLTSDCSININKWYFVSAVYDGSYMELYLNGIQVVASNGNQIGYSTANTTDLLIGNASDFTNEYFNGSIDEVRIYNRALTSDEIQNVYLAK
jgi:hypothetical protein